MAARTGNKMATAVTPLRYKPRDAAVILGIDLQNVYLLVRVGTLSGLWPGGKGPGKRLWLWAGEVDAYAEGGPAAAKAWRKSNRVPEPKGGK